MIGPGSEPRPPRSPIEAPSSELAQLLEQQAATSEVLLAVGRSDFELQPIFETVVEHAIRLCRADAGQIFVREGDHFRLACATGGSDEYRSVIGEREIPLGPGTLVGRVALERRAVTSADIANDPEYDTEEQRLRQRLGGFRSIVGVPIRSEDEVMAVISLWRREVNRFTDREIELAMTFAAQGAIAIRNANLMQQLDLRTRELGRSVDQLSGLSKVGEAVSSSLDLHEVLSTIVKHAVELSGTEGGSIFEFDDESHEFQIRTAYGTSEELLDALRATKVGLHDTLVGRAASTRTSLAVADIGRAPPDDHLNQLARAGWRSMLAVPLLRKNRILGALVVRRRRTGEFSTQITELLETFASQSALAIHNARLFQELALKTDELEVASRHKSEFLASMSHELRTPLNAVIGFSEVLLERLFGELNEKQEEYLEDIRGSGRHLLELLNEILDLSKVEAGQMELELGDTSVREALEHGVAMVRERASRQGLSLDVVVDPDVDVVIADPLRLKQVILNLLTNAVKFTPTGGRVEARARRVDGEIHVSVEDSGIGIAENELERIFESFQQGPRRVSGAAEGTGLGLTLSKRIVELHGGRLWVESHLGQGSTFTFAIPAPTSTTDTKHEPPLGEALAPVGTQTVMTLGDDPLVLELLDSVTSQAGYRLVRATEGEKVVALAQAERPTVIIVDLLSAGVDVFDVVDRVRADPRTRTTPIVVLTTEATTSESKKRLHGQIVRMAQKSELDRDMLLALVRSLARPAEPTEDAWPAS